jgi:hypothetical protein
MPMISQSIPFVAIRLKRYAKILRINKIEVDAKSGLKMRMVQYWTSPTLGNSASSLARYMRSSGARVPPPPERPTMSRHGDVCIERIERIGLELGTE